uniref:E3 ubiquitin-protein ligase MYLIP-like n=1 Tax=Styela clava TaxID=7725 RepID=UPI001939F622|nr:E3 ubiquitin-protein ligase MYLIP-like [Styela clava]
MSLQLDLYNWQSGQILCYVSKPDTRPVVLEVDVDRHAIGQDILEKVCDLIGTVEKDYFGLQVCPVKREPFWMNLRNRVIGQISGQPPYRLRLRVKYYIQPHQLLQESTRQIFYYQLRQDVIDGKLTVPQNKIPQLAAYLAQVEHGDCSTMDSTNIYKSLKFGDKVLTDEDITGIADFHKSLEGQTQSRAMYFFLKEAADLPSYGTEVFNGKIEVPHSHPHMPNLSPADTTNVLMRIGPFGLEIVEEKSEEIRRIPFTAVQLATHTGKMIDIDTVLDDGSTSTLTFRMSSEKSSNALYRCITEMLAFFTWETVHSSVMHQYSRDFKGHLLALFRPDVADQGKQYVFDVQRTWREAYDLARRTLHKQNLRISGSISENSLSSHSVKKHKINQAEQNNEVELLRERLSAIHDALTCRICMDNEINTVFWSCGHQVCCNDCANQCQTCPICRQEITKTQVVFPTVTRDFVATGNMDSGASGGCSPMSISPRSQSPTHGIRSTSLTIANSEQTLVASES